MRNHSFKRRAQDSDEPPQITLKEIVEDMQARTDLAASTVAMNRSALLWMIRSRNVPLDEDAIDAYKLLTELKAPAGRKPKKPRAKSISAADVEKLLDALYVQSGKSIWAGRAALWINAGLACGARPIEWLDAGWTDESETTLQIRTAKIKISAPAYTRKTTPQAELEMERDPELDNPKLWTLSETSPYREIPIQDELLRGIITGHMANIAEAAPFTEHMSIREDLFRDYYNGCRLAINRACHKVWKGNKLHSLYTLRGQFAANMKAKVGSDATSILMGHSRPDSPSTSYYGKANQAHAGFRTGKGADAPRQTQDQRNPQANTEPGPAEYGPVE